MRVKINEEWYDSADVAICIELDTDARVGIIGMPSRKHLYAQFPESDQRTPDERKDWMNEGAQK